MQKFASAVNHAVISPFLLDFINLLLLPPKKISAQLVDTSINNNDRSALIGILCSLSNEEMKNVDRAYSESKTTSNTLCSSLP